MLPVGVCTVKLRQHPSQRFCQKVNLRRLVQGLRVFWQNLREIRGVPGIIGPFRQLEAAEGLGGLLVALVFHQLGHELGTRILCHVPGLEDPRFPVRQQHHGLDLEEGRRHDEEFAGNIYPGTFHLGQVLQVLGAQGGHGDVVDVNFVVLDQVQQEVHGTLESFQLDGIGVFGIRGLTCVGACRIRGPCGTRGTPGIST